MSLITLEYVDTLDADNEKKVLEFSSDLLEEQVSLTSLFVIKVDGKSMQPVIKDRSLVVANLSNTKVEDAGIYLLYNDNKMWIKQAKKEPEGIKFVSINKAFSHLVYNAEDVRVVAKAVLSFNTL